MHNRFHRLRQRHPEIVFDDFDVDIKKNKLAIHLKFILSPNINLSSYYTFNQTIHHQDQLDIFVFHLGLIELFSYWKAACPQQININTGSLNPDQIKWWHQLLINGMGEFYYINNIDFTTPDFITFNTSGTSYQPHNRKLDSKSPLLGIGGGKESALASLLLNKHHQPFIPLMINPVPSSYKLVKTMNLTQPIIIIRQLDPKLIELNQSNYLNGHTPFSALVSFVGIFSAYLNQSQYFIVANESSANEASLHYHDLAINHQYSKSFDYESKFTQYLHNYIHPHQDYFSLLRPLNELQIAQLVAQSPHLLSQFVSCNISGRQGKWCWHCHKCAFTVLTLSAFISPDKIRSIFGYNMLEDDAVIDLFKDLALSQNVKPLDCVGTQPEAQCALRLALIQYQQSNLNPPNVLTQLEPDIQDENNDCQSLLTSWNKHHLIPDDFLPIIKYAIKSD